MGTLFINIGDIYCFGTGFLISMSKDPYQYHHLNKNCKLILQIFEGKPKSEEIVHFHILKFSIHF